MVQIRLSLIFIITLFASFFMVGVGHARVVKIGIGFSLPPYVIMKDDTGLEVDVIRESFAAVGLDAEFVYLPNLRLPVAFADGMVDCVATNVAYDVSGESGLKACGSDVTLFFQNYAIAVKSAGYDLKSIDDLKDKVVLGFNNAVKYLGPDFAAVAAGNPNYTELADQSLQVRMLYSGRVQVVISDKRVFHYWRKVLLQMPVAETLDLNQDIQFFPIFAPAPRHLSFSDVELCRAFNQGLRLLHSTGVYEGIIQRYVDVEIE